MEKYTIPKRKWHSNFKEAKDMLFKECNIVEVIYLPVGIEESAKSNEVLLKDSSMKNIVYAIWEKVKGESNFEVKYVGHAKSNGSRTRLRNHLFKKHEKTGSKLKYVTDSITSDNNIGVTFVEIDPGYFRSAIEEYIIGSTPDLVWNIHSKSKK
jgi:hypothetical protein